jgi:hypothetical protein
MEFSARSVGDVELEKDKSMENAKKHQELIDQG